MRPDLQQKRSSDLHLRYVYLKINMCYPSRRLTSIQISMVLKSSNILCWKQFDYTFSCDFDLWPYDLNPYEDNLLSTQETIRPICLIIDQSVIKILCGNELNGPSPCDIVFWRVYLNINRRYSFLPINQHTNRNDHCLYFSRQHISWYKFM